MKLYFLDMNEILKSKLGDEVSCLGIYNLSDLSKTNLMSLDSGFVPS